MNPLIVVGLVIVGIFALIIFFAALSAGMLWFQSLVSGAQVGLFNIVFMRFRKVPPKLIVESKISAVKAGLDIDTNSLESHYLAGGNVMRVVQALIAADKANIPLTFDRAAAIDLAGRNVLEAVQMSVNPRVIETPLVAAVAKDGIQLKAISRVTVRANIDRLVGGAGEETILARVGEGIVTTIGSATTHKDVLENPDMISKRVLEKGLDAGTAFEILSIDIADVDVGKNIGAELETDRAEADKRIAQAKAEERRAMAVAEEQEMKARVQEMRAKVVEAEAEVPQAMAEAFRGGNLGIMDYYRMKNVDADTRMRDSIGKETSRDQGKRPEGE
ncbi:MAG: flotillin-like protein FloA [Chitinivibrionales bacterium]|nr:flotillin-like protein FloA [Chitinivibrionales bacterium]